VSTNFTYIGKTNWRTQEISFGIKDADRFGHIYCIGKTGVGKSSLLLNMAISDVEKGKGLCVIDPHGDIAETLLNYIPKARIGDVTYFNAKDTEFPIGFNPLEGINPEHHHLVASNLISTFKRIWEDNWGPRLEYILHYCFLTLLYYPHATLLDIQPLLTDYRFRSKVLTYVINPHIHSFWREEFDKYPAPFKAEAITPILNKSGVFLSNTILRNIVGQQTGTIQIQDILDQGKILIANLSKGEIGEDASSILGSILVTSIQLATLYRASQKEDQRNPFFLYLDECHSFLSLSFARILSEARKYKLSLFLTHQYIGQLSEAIREAVFGNVGTTIAFRVGAEDATYLEKEFHPIFSEADFINLPLYSIYIKLMIDGATSKPFSAETFPVKKISNSFKREIINLSRSKFGRHRQDVEKEIYSSITSYSESENLTLFNS